MLQNLLLLAYRLPSQPFRRYRTWQDERKGRRRHHKTWKDTGNQEGREDKGDVHQKCKTHLFSVFISTLLSEVLYLSQFSKAKMNSYWILSFNSSTAWTWFGVWVLPFALCNFARVTTSDQNSHVTQTLVSICFHCCQGKNHIREKMVWGRGWTENIAFFGIRNIVIQKCRELCVSE